MTDLERAAAVRAVREAAGRLRAVPRAHLEALVAESSGADREVGHAALRLLHAEHGRQIDALSRAGGGPCRAATLLERTGARAVTTEEW